MANHGQQRSILGWNQPERSRDKARCPRCGGMLYLVKLPDDGPRRKFSEWTCLACGQTYYPRRKEESVMNGNKPQETGSPWTT